MISSINHQIAGFKHGFHIETTRKQVINHQFQFWLHTIKSPIQCNHHPLHKSQIKHLLVNVNAIEMKIQALDDDSYLILLIN